jgi:hypothetical protein
MARAGLSFSGLTRGQLSVFVSLFLRTKGSESTYRGLGVEPGARHGETMLGRLLLEP